MNKPFNDQPVETLVEQHLIQEGTVLDLRRIFGIQFCCRGLERIGINVNAHLETIGRAARYGFCRQGCLAHEQQSVRPFRVDGFPILECRGI